MAIVVKNMIVNGKQPEPPKEAPATVSRIVRNVRQEPQVPEYSGDSVLIVDGKPKKVSKRSAYMLDMLTIDDEE